MGVPGSANALLLASTAAGGYTISRSLRFNSSDSAFLSRVFGSPTNQIKFTFSVWVKRSTLGGNQQLFQGGASDYSDSSIYFESDNTLAFRVYNGSNAEIGALKTSQVFRDTGAWFHVLAVYDSANATAADRMQLYVNGYRITTFTTQTNPSQNAIAYSLNTNGVTHYIGSYRGTSNYFSGYLADIHFIDGQALTPSSFGEYDTNNVWQPKAYSGGSYGTNGFHLDFADNSAATATTLGKDTSGNSNNWTPNNLSVTQGTGNWSTQITSSSGFNASFPPLNGFDGDTSSYCQAVSDGSTLTFSPSPGIAYTSSIKILMPAAGATASVNGGSAVSVGNNVETTIASGSGTLTSLILTASNKPGFQYIKIDDNLLLDYRAVAAGNDSLVDSPTNGTASSGGDAGGVTVGNYCTFNPLDTESGCTLSNGNLEVSTNGGRVAVASFGIPTSGKWYWEGTFLGGTGTDGWIGAIPVANRSDGSGRFYRTNGQQLSGASWTAYGASYGQNDVIGVALDQDNNTITFYKNNTSQGAQTSVPLRERFAACNNDGATGWAFNFGQRPFAYTAPSGYKALCTANLPTPTIANGATAMDVKLYTGNGSTQTISGLNFSPDFIWLKSRSSGSYSHNIYDIVRGATKIIYSDSGSAENTDASGLTAFNSDGFSLGSTAATNASSTTYVGWCWDAGANSSKTYTVTVVSGAFYIDGKQQPTLNLEEGSTYTFDLSAASNSGHPFRLSESANGPTQYTTGVTTSGTAGNAGATLTIAVASGAPTLYYFCTNHSGMGGQINTNTTAGASNFAGSITSQVRANASAGFSIVTYTGTGANATIGHGGLVNLSNGMIIVKNRASATNWRVYHGALGNTKTLFLSTTGTPDTNSVYWNNTSPTSTVFSVGSDDGVNGNVNAMVAYCFAPVAGYSAFGSYTGNGSADGPFVYTGFRPRWVMIKRTDAAFGWYMYDTARDTYNIVGKEILANESSAEVSDSDLDILSNGFKPRRSSNAFNASAGTFIYAAFAESPFAYARAR